MIFAPHILQVKVITPMDKDEFGRPIPGTGGESWQEVCKCRCDDVSAEKKVSINGALYDFKYKVVFDKPSKVEAGAEIRCLNVDGSIRADRAKETIASGYQSQVHIVFPTEDIKALTDKVSNMERIVDEMRTFQVEGNMDRRDILENSVILAKNSPRILDNTNDIKQDIKNL